MASSSTLCAGPSRQRPAPISILPKDPQTTSIYGLQNARARTPTRASTNDQEVELSVYLGPRCQPSTPSSITSVPLSPSNAGISVSSSVLKSKGMFLMGSEWRTDIVTFCSHVRVGSVLGEARITHVQARKSRRPPFLHEYILVFFTTANDQRFVARIDRLGKVGSTSDSGLLPSWCGGRERPAANMALQQVEVYQIQDSQIGIDSPDGPWCVHDGVWGSYSVATLVHWPDVSTTTIQVSHHTQTAAAQGGAVPHLADVSRLLEAVLLEMPTYRLTTTNCYFMTRSSLLLLQQCFPNSFACFLGSASGELVPSTELAEPVWAGLVRWYLPFVIFVLVVYATVIVLAHCMFFNIIVCQKVWQCPRSLDDTWVDEARRLAPHSKTLSFWQAWHGFTDVPLPVGILHAWMTALELQMNSLVTRLLAEYQRLERGVPGTGLIEGLQPFGVPFQRAWTVFALWCCAGIIASICIFIVLIANHWVTFGFFMAFLIGCAIYTVCSSEGDTLQLAEDMFAALESDTTINQPRGCESGSRCTQTSPKNAPYSLDDIVDSEQIQIEQFP